MMDHNHVSVVAHFNTSEQWLGGYDPAPLTYVNQRRWEDEGPKKPITQEEREEKMRDYLRSIGRHV